MRKGEKESKKENAIKKREIEAEKWKSKKNGHD